MARLNRSFVVVATASMIALHAVVLPALYFALGFVIRKNHEDLFVQHARTFTRVLADEFELGGALDSERSTSDRLDLAVIHGEARFAELVTGDRVVRSQLGSMGIKAPHNPDQGLRYDGDDVYLIVLPIVHAGSNSHLRLGFDKRPTEERIQLELNRLLWMLAGYAFVTIGVAIFLSNRFSRPLRCLQDASRAIAAGDYAQALRVESGVRELSDLAVALDAMRSELVGVNVRLQQQIREKELAESRREALEKQLRHRRRLETVGALAGGVAHEFNNVLVPIMLFTNTAMQDLAPDSLARADLERVLVSARRAKNVVQKILTYSHVLGETALTAIDLKPIVNEALDLFRALTPPSVEIRALLDDNIPPVMGDAALALDLVMNLCTNALQSMRGTTGVMTIGLRSLQAVEFSVTDTGHGMDAATLQRIFEPFFTTRPVGEGTGLGLAVVHGIVKSFSATIAVESAVGGGTTIRIYFPPASPRPAR